MDDYTPPITEAFCDETSLACRETGEALLTLNANDVRDVGSVLMKITEWQLALANATATAIRRLEERIAELEA